MLMLDLFSGLKGASRAMTDRGWDVISVDIDPILNPTICCDIRDYEYRGPRPDLIWASPDCRQFTRHRLPWFPKVLPDMSLVLAAKRIIDDSKPKFWVIENVNGAVTFFNPVLGPLKKRVGSRYLWGYFPIFDCPPQYGKNKIRCKDMKEQYQRRSEIPYVLSLSLAKAIELYEAKK